MRINTNMAALNAWRNMSVNSGNTQKSLEKLSSGFRINRAADDAAGLAVSEKMRAQIRGTNMATRNAQDGISLVQTAEGALTETHSMLQRMRELSVQSASSTLQDPDRALLQEEFTQLREEVSKIAGNTSFNGRKLLDGASGVSLLNGTPAVIKGLTATGDTQAAVLSLAGVVAAKAAVTMSDAATIGTGLTGAAALKHQATINGIAYSFDGGTTSQAVLDRINADTTTTGVTASIGTGPDAGKLLLTSKAVGGSAAIAVTGATNDFVGLVAQSGTVAAATVNGYNAAQVTVTGNRVELTGGPQKGLAFDIDPATTSATNATITVGVNNALSIQTGADTNQTLSIAIQDMRSGALGLDLSNIGTQSGANTAIKTLDDSITTVSTQRAKLGAIQNRLEHTVASLQVTSENLQGAESRIRDVDMAAEMANFTKNNILQQASQAMLAQANQSTQGVLSLLR